MTGRPIKRTLRASTTCASTTPSINWPRSAAAWTASDSATGRLLRVTAWRQARGRRAKLQHIRVDAGPLYVGPATLNVRYRRGCLVVVGRAVSGQQS